MPAHFAGYTGYSPGVILLRAATPISTAIAEIVLFWSASDAAEWFGRLLWIPL